MTGAQLPAILRALAQLAERGLLAADGTPSAAGRALRREVEQRTDVLAQAPATALGERGAARLVELATPWALTIAASDAFLPDNPMGLRPPPPLPGP